MQAAAAQGTELPVVKLPQAKCDFAWMSRFRRLARDYDRLPEILANLHFVAFVCLLLRRVIPYISNP